MDNEDMTELTTSDGGRFPELLMRAARLPGVRIDRTGYLRTALRNHCTEDVIDRAIATTPAVAGVPSEVLEKIAKESIAFEGLKVTTLSAAAGIPGWAAMAATVPADMAQFLGHMLRISQKLAYVYSWPDLFDPEGTQMDDGTQAVLTLFIGVMAGASSASAAVGKVSVMISEQVARTLPQKALTKGVLYPVVKKVASLLGAKMTKQVFARGVAKAVPVLGAVVSGGVTVATFVPMSNRLRKHLAGLELARTGEPPESVAPALDAPVPD